MFFDDQKMNIFLLLGIKNVFNPFFYYGQYKD